MNDADRDRFDALLDDVVDALPPAVRNLLDEKPVIVEDRPSSKLLKELGIDGDEELLCGLHTGTPLTERSVEALPEMELIHLFREAIVEMAGGWDEFVDDDGEELGGEKRVSEEIRITLLHEIGHHFGLEEDDLDELGYG